VPAVSGLLPGGKQDHVLLSEMAGRLI